MVFHKKNICILACIIISNLAVTPIFGLTEIKSSLYFSENPITFDPPMVKKNKTPFIPIRSLIYFFDGTINKSNVTYEYTITINNQTLKIKPNRHQYKINETQKRFDEKPFIYKTRLYVPLKSIANNLGRRCFAWVVLLLKWVRSCF